MRCLLITVGSRGDAEPFMALADQLLSAHHEVHLFWQKEYEYIATPHPGLTIHHLPFTQQDFYPFVANASHGQEHSDPRVRFTGILADLIGELVLPCMKEVFRVASQNQVQMILCSTLARPMCVEISQALGCYLGIVHLQPLALTRVFSHTSHDKTVEQILAGNEHQEKKEGDANQETYLVLERYQAEFLQERLLQTCQQVWGETSKPLLNDSVALEQLLSGKAPKTLVLNCFANSLCPVPPHDHVYNVGGLADEFLPADFVPPPRLVEFLAKHQDLLPVAVGFGSMPTDAVSEVLNALESIGRPAILIGNALSKYEQTGWAQANIIHVASIPYPWLLPQCYCMIHHGGAGVVHATLRAGIPQVVTPFFGDQFFWAKLLEARGLGVDAGKLTDLSAQVLKTCLSKVNNEMVIEAKKWGKDLADCHGAQNMVQLLETIVKE